VTRWSALLLLLALPLTMAPKIALTGDPEVLAISAVVPRGTVRPGDVVTTTFRVTNVSGATVDSGTLRIGVIYNSDAKEPYSCVCRWAARMTRLATSVP